MIKVLLDLPSTQFASPVFDYLLPRGPEPPMSAHPGLDREQDPASDREQDPASDRERVPARGDWVLVPWGRGRRIGIVAGVSSSSELPRERLRPLIELLADAPRLPEAWLQLVEFAAHYYHRGQGEVALPAIPKSLRTPQSASARSSVFIRARRRFAPAVRRPAAETASTRASAVAMPGAVPAPSPIPAPSAGQAQVLAVLGASTGFTVSLLHGVTGSGKTEVYLQWIARVLDSSPNAQVLLLVPEIGLTPQLAAQVTARFPQESTVILHSDLADGDRAAHWLASVEGKARLVVGTRLAVLTPLPHLAAIVVDEEHDTSFKQQEGVRYSARDLAVMAASQRGIPILLGSATPSLESWLAARRRRYRLLKLPERIGSATLPQLEIIDLRGLRLQHQLSTRAIEAISETVAGGAQALVFINRRGYAPVLHCEHCGWLSRCPDCSAYRVLHRIGPARAAARSVDRRYRLICHHCSREQPVPRHCPDCGSVSLDGLGRGTQRLEEGLAELFPQARIGRLDRDVARRKGAAERLLDAAHAGDIDLLVGTQMLAKGHDFRRLALVVVVDSDGGLFASDYRASERLFATLMQVAGRAGRDARASRVLVQTRFPDHPLFRHLERHDYDGFADRLLGERKSAQLPPFRFQALLRAEAASLDVALSFLTRARAQGQALLEVSDHCAARAHGQEELKPLLLDPVPMAMSRLAGRERAQLLVESASRRALHQFLDAWLPAVRTLPDAVRWALDVDPAEI